MWKTVLAGALLCAFAVIDAEARPRMPAPSGCVETVMLPCYAVPVATKAADRREARRVARGRYIADRLGYGGVADKPSTVVAHPPGCPWRAFCGCGAAVRVFGRPVRDLWLAANWFRFPRAAPAAGMVAVRRHHVFVLEQHLGGSTWLAYDANSGRHATRVHARSITGFVIVNPHS